MSINPLHTTFSVEDQRVFAKENRRTGQSTVLALKYIAGAIEKPNTRIRITDHYPSERADEHLASMMRDMIAKMDLSYLKISRVSEKQGMAYYIKFADE